MRAFVRHFSSITFFLLLLTTIAPNITHAQYVVVAPNPAAENKPAFLMVAGCPDGQVTFTWKKNNSVSATTVSDGGFTAYKHEAGFSTGTYALNVKCGSLSADTSFSSQKLTGSGWEITLNNIGERTCRQASGNLASSFLFDSQSNCEGYLSQMRSLFAGKTWFLNGVECFETVGIPLTYGDFFGPYYPSKDACTTAQATSRFDVVTEAPLFIPACRASANGQYSSRSACDLAIGEQYVFIINSIEPTSPLCQQVKKDSSAGSKTYPTDIACRAAIVAQLRWALHTPEDALGGRGICYQSLGGNYDSKASCESGFCNILKESDDQSEIIKTAFSQYCKAVEAREHPPLDPESDPPPCTAEISTDGCISVYSAFGNFSTSPEGFLTKLFSILLSVSGGIALLFIIRSGYQLMTSQGDPEKVKEARERITSAIVGLLFLVFSLVILEVIGVDILAIPGLNR